MWTSHLTVGVYLIIASSSLFDVAEPSVVMEKMGGRTRNEVAEFFPEIQGDLTRVSWAHAVNNKELLEKALKDPHLMMLEADVLMGFVKSESSHPSHEKTEVAIMAHPPDNSSDLLVEDFLETVVKFTSEENARKGIKLDIKDIQALHQVLKSLKKLKSAIHFPVWLNADVWKGPGNSHQEPVDAAKFIKTIQDKFKKSSFQPTLSLGWTTNYGHDSHDEEHKSENAEAKAKHDISSGRYSTEDVKTAIQSLKKFHVIGEKSDEGVEVTFPLRAGLAVHSVDQVEELLKEAGPRSTITLWSAKEDTKIDDKTLEEFVDKIGKTRVFLDLPFPLSFVTSVILTTPTPTEVPSLPTLPPVPRRPSEKPSKKSRKSKDLTVVDETGRMNNGTEKPDDDDTGSTTPSNSGSSLSTLSLLLLFCCTVFIHPAQ